MSLGQNVSGAKCPLAWFSELNAMCKNPSDDDAGDEYANCKPSSGGESFCAKNFDKCIPDQPAARNRYGHAFQDDDVAKLRTSFLRIRKK